MKSKFKNNEKGFALPLALLLLVVMTIMGVILVTTTSNEHKANTNKDISQQTFYAAESGISQAKKYLVETNTLRAENSPNSKSQFCKTSFFPNLNQSTVKAINTYVGKNNLSELISAPGEEGIRLSKYSFEYFITYTPDVNGNTPDMRYKAGTSNPIFTIHSCGCNESKDKCEAQSNIIVPLEAVVTLIK